MKIHSRPQEDEDVVIGAGSCTLQLTLEQLELISALMCTCRLGKNSPYSTAAYEIISEIEATYGTDFLDDATDHVDPQCTIEDDAGVVVMDTRVGNYDFTLEV